MQVDLLDSPEAAEAAEYSASLDLKGTGGLTIGIARAHGRKCTRCWNYSPQVHHLASSRAFKDAMRLLVVVVHTQAAG